MMLLIFLTLFALYFFCMMRLIFGYKKVRPFSSSDIVDKSEEKITKTGFSVIIPFRNEAENLPELLNSIEKLNYPSHFLEFIFINDASEDNSEAIVNEATKKSKFSIKLLQNKRISNSPKKDAISEAIKKANFEWLITTDADCNLPPNWLKVLDGFIQVNNPAMICGPVKYESNGSFIENFQQMDGLSLQAVTIGSFEFGNPILCNGANLAYTKNAFLKVNGFSGNDMIASGDDIFLLEKMKKEFPGKIQYIKSEEAIVFTKPQNSWRDIVNQRIRWASKTSKQKSAVSLFLGMTVFLVNISILTYPVFVIFDSENWLFYLSFVVFKISTDFIFVKQAARFFDLKISFWRFPLQTFVYAAILFIVVLGSFRGRYLWKGRSFKNP